MNLDTMKPQDLEERLIDFAVEIIGIVEGLPETKAGRHLAAQLVRSGTAPAAHYGEAQGAESRNDFIHKMKIALKELRESLIWLKIAGKRGMLPEECLWERLAVVSIDRNRTPARATVRRECRPPCVAACARPSHCAA